MNSQNVTSPVVEIPVRESGSSHTFRGTIRIEFPSPAPGGTISSSSTGPGGSQLYTINLQSPLTTRIEVRGQWSFPGGGGWRAEVQVTHRAGPANLATPCPVTPVLLTLGTSQEAGSRPVNLEQECKFSTVGTGRPDSDQTVYGQIYTLVEIGIVGVRPDGSSGGAAIFQQNSVTTLYEWKAGEMPRPDKGDPPSFGAPYSPRSEPRDTNFTGVVQNTCVFRDQSPIRIPIAIDRHVGVTESGDIRRSAFNGYLSRTARLRIAAWDVDSNSPLPEGKLRELDRVFVNGREVGALKGGDGEWSLNTFDVPVEHLRFPEKGTGGQPPAPARNEIRIDVDSANIANTWCVAVQWASVSFAAMGPLVLVHGTHAQSDTWEFTATGRSPVDFLKDELAPFEYKIDLMADGSPEENARLLDGHLKRIAKEWNARALHLITHSKGATDSRVYLNKYHLRPLVNGVLGQREFNVLSLYSLGTPSQGTILSDYAILAEQMTGLGTFSHFTDFEFPEADADVVRAAFREGTAANAASVFGGAPVDPARRQQTIAGMEDFNVRYPPVAGVGYFSIAGNADRDGSGTVDIAEARSWLPFPLPVTAGSALGNSVYQALGRTQSITIRTERNRFTPDRLVVSGSLAAQPAANDLVSTAASTHCRTCGFTPLGTEGFANFEDEPGPGGVFGRNHSGLKNGRIIGLIVEHIRRRFPLIAQ
ncbi:MAG: hypothetical protein SFV51_21210 [Bryobacteraceae bacterium]|nr:hypothetical protein [Bryobacteraceae bacterium]